MTVQEYVAFSRDGKGVWFLEGEVSRGDLGGLADSKLQLVLRGWTGAQVRTRSFSVKQTAAALGVPPPSKEGRATEEEEEQDFVALDPAPLVRAARAMLGEEGREGKAPSAQGLRVAIEPPPSAAECELETRAARGFWLRIEGEGLQRVPVELEPGPVPFRSPTQSNAVVSPDGRFVVSTVSGSVSQSFHEEALTVSRIVALRPECQGKKAPADCDRPLAFVPVAGEPESCAAPLAVCAPRMGQWACLNNGRCTQTEQGYRCSECASDADCTDDRNGKGRCVMTPVGARCGGCFSNEDCAGQSMHYKKAPICDIASHSCGQCTSDADCERVVLPDARGCAMNPEFRHSYQCEPDRSYQWHCSPAYDEGRSCYPSVHPLKKAPASP